jgi:exonuclease VII small subunit
MALPVDVRSVQVLHDLRAALAAFAEDARNALSATEMEITRMVDWLTHDRRLHWEAEIRRRRQDVSRHRTELARKRTAQMFGSDASLAEARELLRQSQHALEHAEGQLLRVKKWAAPLQQALMEYRGQAQPLGDHLGGDFERARAELDRMVGAIEAYLADAVPTTEATRTIRREALAPSAARPGSDPDPPPPDGGTQPLTTLDPDDPPPPS